MRPYEGLLTAMVTPFHGDGAVNEEAAVALGRHLLANGSNGLVVGGTTGESATLTDDELVAPRRADGRASSATRARSSPARAPTAPTTRSS